MGNMLSAGVMLSAGFCHLLADAIKPTMEAVPKFPLAPFLCALGFLLTLTADTYASKYAKQHQKTNGMNPIINGSARLLSETQQQSDEANTNDDRLPSTSVLVPSHEDTVSNGHSGRSMECLEIDNGGQQEPRVSFLTALFLGLALSLHSVLEGLALGAQQTINASKDVLLAIAAHKGLAAYALGASLVDSKTTGTKFFRVAGLFSLASPVGILIGYGLSEVSNGTGAASLSALASGTFLYVAMMEVIPNELHDGENITSKLIVMFLGFGAMSTLAVWA
eukprot:g1150.t1